MSICVFHLPVSSWRDDQLPEKDPTSYEVCDTIFQHMRICSDVFILSSLHSSLTYTKIHVFGSHINPFSMIFGFNHLVIVLHISDVKLEEFAVFRESFGHRLDLRK